MCILVHMALNIRVLVSLSEDFQTRSRRETNQPELCQYHILNQSIIVLMKVVFLSALIYVSVAHALLRSLRPSWASSATKVASSVVDMSELGLTPILEKYCVGLRGVKDDKLRYQQLMFLASKCTPMVEALKVDTNKVPGCLSTVHVHATLGEDGKIDFVGDSDGQLTKGLVAMLVTGLSGHTAAEIESVDPRFIQYAGIANSLTPGRNNGFLNMLTTMKNQAKAVGASSSQGTEAVEDKAVEREEVEATPSSQLHPGTGPIEMAMNEKLAQLQPKLMVIENESHKHAGHAGMAGATNVQESHFNLRIVSDAFEGLSLVKRHRMVYALLAKEMAPGGIHALSIKAETPTEAST